MDFRLTDTQELLTHTARSLFQQHCPTTLVQQLALDARGFPDDLWRQCAALGWPGLLVPAALDGSDGTLLDVVLLVEEMGRACFPGPYIQSAVVATSLVLMLGSPAQQALLLPGMARGERLATLALTEESADFTPEAITMQADVGGMLQGSKLFVKDAHVADWLFVVVRGNGGFNVVRVARDQAGVTLWPLEVMSGEKLFEVAFDHVQVSAEALIGSPGMSWEALTPVLQRGALARSAEMVGCAQYVLDTCVAYAKVREQSGRPIGAFQAIQHHCADLLRNVEGSRYILYNAAWRMQTGLACAADVAMAKAHISEACLAVARKGHQILGAISYCEEHPLHIFHKRIQAAGLDFGAPSMHLETVAQAIGLVPLR
ncbi:MAG: acyl-CoA dehydrogenase [Candidatus Tectomicrobia bacterium]|uniref:Acyl-CoA dehydrogenase n=1 Tax=Tectimicrobiota bacterium TaxID=2528274 RepID=A0A937W2S5_UNCTE|nr:acyl-CoA dehydrogenase [Candidatus Tectomicrobia bacterium]